jgi:hypothetical protein
MFHQVHVESVSVNDTADHALKQSAKLITGFSSVSIVRVFWVQLGERLLYQEGLIDIELPHTNIYHGRNASVKMKKHRILHTMNGPLTATNRAMR